MSAADDVIKLTIFNSALRQAQSPRIQKTTETSASAMACDDMYGPIYDEALMAFEQIDDKFSGTGSKKTL